ncbi:hypothetical protein NKH77_40260 [Streptomyces sp. M19]
MERWRAGAASIRPRARRDLNGAGPALSVLDRTSLPRLVLADDSGPRVAGSFRVRGGAS